MLVRKKNMEYFEKILNVWDLLLEVFRTKDLTSLIFMYLEKNLWDYPQQNVNSLQTELFANMADFEAKTTTWGPPLHFYCETPYLTFIDEETELDEVECDGIIINVNFADKGAYVQLGKCDFDRMVSYLQQKSPHFMRCMDIDIKTKCSRKKRKS